MTKRGNLIEEATFLIVFLVSCVECGESLSSADYTRIEAWREQERDWTRTRGTLVWGKPEPEQQEEER